jgi:hypothetical protein
VMAGQHATAFANGKSGLSLGGSGTFSPIEHGKPRASSIERVPVPRGGLTAIRHATNAQSIQPSRNASAHPARPGVTRISSSIGEVRVNFHRVTNGLAHGATSPSGAARGVTDTSSNTVWNSSGSDSASVNDGQGNNGNGAEASAAGRGNASAVAAIGGGNANNGNGNGGNSGNSNSGSNNGANGSGNGANGSGRGNGHASNGNGQGRGR